MSHISEQLKDRTMRFALDVCAVIKTFPPAEPGPTAKRQLARAATGVAFNYRASCRARTHTEFTAKIGLVAEEADESQGWLDFIIASKLMMSTEASRLLREASELTAIISASVGTARRNERQRNR